MASGRPSPWSTASPPLYDAVVDRFGQLAPDIARGIKLRHDWGPHTGRSTSSGSIGWLGFDDEAAYIGELESNGCVDRFSAPAKNSAYGRSSTTPSTTSAKQSPPGPTLTSSNAKDT